jgi:hypothetical protein
MIVAAPVADNPRGKTKILKKAEGCSGGRVSKGAWLWVRMIPVFLAIQILSAAELKTAAIQAWDKYLQWADAKVQKELADPKIFLIQNTLLSQEKSSIQKQLQSEQIVVLPMRSIVPSGAQFTVPGGEIHHWWGAILLRNMRLAQLMRFLQDYDHHAGKFSDVERSKLLEKKGDNYRIYFRLRRSKSFVTAYYNTEQECRYVYYGANRIFSQSVTTKIAELEDPGRNSEREKLPGNDRGFLWRLVSWWRFEQIGNDVIVELESASLSRDIPAAVKFIPGISSYIHATPRETLESVLAGIRNNMNK